MRVKSQGRRVKSRRALSPRLTQRPRALTSDFRPLTSPARGLTLIELLIVIIILTTLVSAAIPIMAPTNDDRRLREASRSANAFISAAQMKAVQLQRPVGVALKRLSQDTNSDPSQVHEDNAVCIELYYVEQPAPYRGFDRTSAAMVARHTVASRAGQVLIRFVVRGNAEPQTNDNLPIGWDADLFPPSLIRPGDVIEIDGTRYLLRAPDGFSPPDVRQSVRVTTSGYEQLPGVRAVTIEAVPQNDTGQMLNIAFDAEGRKLRDPILTGSATREPPFWTNPAAYKILRQPMPTSAEPFQMPEGTAIDLRASGQAIEIEGTGMSATASGFFYNPDAQTAAERVDNADPIVVMFTPEGAVERVRFNQENVGVTEDPEVYDARTVSNIYLLVGRRQNAPPPEPTITADKTLDPMYPTLTDQQKQEAKEPVNWLLGESRWIVIGSQSGRVVTVENAFVDPGPLVTNFPTPKDVLRARQIDASREFAREMVQVGGR